MKSKFVFLAFLSFVFFSFSCKKEESELDKISGLWYVRIIAEQQVNEKGVLAFKSYLEYKPNDNGNYATFNFHGNQVTVEERRNNLAINKTDYTYAIDGNNLVLSGSSTSEVYKMSYLGIKNSLVLDKSEVDKNNIPFNLKKVLVRVLPKPDKIDEEIGSEPNQGTPTGGE